MSLKKFSTVSGELKIFVQSYLGLTNMWTNFQKIWEGIVRQFCSLDVKLLLRETKSSVEPIFHMYFKWGDSTEFRTFTFNFLKIEDPIINIWKNSWKLLSSFLSNLNFFRIQNTFEHLVSKITIRSSFLHFYQWKYQWKMRSVEKKIMPSLFKKNCLNN